MIGKPGETLVTGAGFSEIDHYYRPAGLPREQQPWIASVWRKPTRRKWSNGVLEYWVPTET